MPAGNHPTVFIGSSTESLHIADHLQALLDPYTETTIWNQGVFGLTRTALDDLIKRARRSDFAILALHRDDTLIRRGITTESPRDNVIFELGLFIGALGRERTFIVHSRHRPPNVPTDLLGVTAALYNERQDGNIQAALGPAALAIRKAMEEVGAKKVAESMDDDSSLEQVLTHAADLAATFITGVAGVDYELSDKAMNARWRGNVLGVVQSHFGTRSPDVYTAWLRPTEATPPRLAVTAYRNLEGRHRHYTFATGEGLAGRVWSTGTAAAHWASRPHPWWVYREGCENTTYLCAAVGAPNGPRGVLAVGSDLGFVPAAGDLSVVRLFAAMLNGAMA